MFTDNAQDSGSSIDQTSCFLCNSKRNLDVKIIQCFTKTTWRAMWNIGGQETEAETFTEKGKPINWKVVLCRACQVEQYIEANRKKTRKLKNAIFNVVVAGSFGLLIWVFIYFGGPIETIQGNAPDAEIANTAVEVAYTLIMLVGLLCIISIFSLPILLVLFLRAKKRIQNAKLKKIIPRRDLILAFIHSGRTIAKAGRNKFKNLIIPEFPIEPSVKKIDYYNKKDFRDSGVSFHVLKKEYKFRKAKI